MDGDGANEDDQGLGIDVILQQDGDKKAPSCLHGPALLFEKVCRGEEKGRRFYACSACRDRKDCNFFQWEDEKVSEARLQAREMEKQSKRPQFTHKEYCSRLKRFGSQPAGERMFCQDCQILLLPSERVAHAAHRSVEVGAAQLSRPSALLRPLENKKSNAQYLFTDRSANFLLTTLAGLGYRRVLCVGTPRLHELIKLRTQEKKDDPMKSLLLDIDLRYAQFYGEDEFCHYNMFNHHFFGGEASSQVLQAFLSEAGGEKVVMVADPPFGGLVNPLAHTFSLISQLWRKLQSPGDNGSSGDMPMVSGDMPMVSGDMPMVWVFPYFFEARILQCLPSLTMLDYQVDYDNHPLYKHGKTGRKQSPVKMFTNLSPRAIVLPASEGYRLCAICERYVFSLNKHCAKCNVCPSKDGREWRHCEKCEKCVKPSWKHCQKCGHCALPGHPCGQENKEGCFVCGSLKHRRNACKQRLAQRTNKANAKGGKKHLPPRPAFKPAGKRKSGASRRNKKAGAAPRS